MSSHVVVLDSTARRATIKTTPGKYLADILQEACAKLGLDASQYGLKYKSKQVDLSLSFRLSGLASGAKLELVQLSRSPSVVTVALQLPESEARGVPNGRLLDKFPSTTTLWLVLRKFEAGVAGGGSPRNFTARGIPIATAGNEGSGRLFYETPVVQIMGRELSTFDELQKSLVQLGFNSGNVLVRLSFRRTEEPLEVAMVKIQDYFKSFDDATPKDATSKTQESPAAETSETITDPSQPLPQAPSAAPAEPVRQVPEVPEQAPQTVPAAVPAAGVPSTEPSATIQPSSRPVTVFSAPSSTTPQAAQMTYNEDDYVPSVDHAQAHQRRLNAASRPIRLPTDAEIAAKAAEEEQRRAAVKEVDVKVRLPDQSQVVSKFGQEDTGATLYGFVRSCLAEPFASEKFVLTSFPVAGAPKSGAKKVQNIVPDSNQTRLIKDFGMIGRVLVTFTWDASASPAVRQSRTSPLKPELRSQAQEIKVEQPPDVMDTSEDRVASKVGGPSQGEKPGGRKPGSIPKWLKLPGKK
ncbi:putative UBX domain protein [Aspergillus clavatus NRRL 1]|uniref:UBX domain protein, putative n=1 Tax=Aspergillus clavatus (strain ATCC 1007 / CBS 513.65 / DSM 816 / NCTC 3887 / NRRL 1 / QM 1276 / 107) TaxID=344612 RepID=A1CH54_ASPCL|nr:UBX domain protein, putative [Aspergillus clavatus NRRL 1]EAW10209.1 UBX domain protein, putative [Aspergillus clavatus NRRL 1]